MVTPVDFISPLIGIGQLTLLLGIFYRMGLVRATLADHAERIERLEATAACGT